MSQPHPPIPEPQPQPQPQPQPDDNTGSTVASATDLPGAPAPAAGPRTQSILVPPSQRPESPAEPAPQPAGPFRTAQFAAVRDEPHPVTGPVDPEVGFAAAVPGAAPWIADAPPPVPGPSTAPVATSEPQTHPVAAPTPPAADQFAADPAGSGPAASDTAAAPSGPAQPGAAHRAGAKLAGVQRAAGGRTVLVGLGLNVLALVLLQIGLVLDDGTSSLWEALPTWSTFATLAVLVALTPAAVRLLGRGLPARTAWQVGAGGVAALSAFWVLVGLPLVVSDRGFWLTAALGAAGAALWLAPGRPE